MNIYDVMKIPAYERAALIAGRSGGWREVQHVNMMDAPDIADFLHKNELLVTTAYHLKDRPQLLKDLIRLMAKRGCAGLGIKTKRYLNVIPKDAVELADRYEFPIIELPEDIRLGDIVNATLSHILDMRSNELQQAIYAHKKFTNHIMSGKGLQSLLKKLSDILRLPVLLLDQHIKLLSSSHSIPIDTSLLKNICYSLSGPYFTCFSMLSDRKAYSVLPILNVEKNCGYLVIPELVQTADKGMILTIEQAANVISFELLKENAVKQFGRRARNEFFSNFIDRSFTGHEEIKSRAKEFRLRWDQKYMCICGKLDRNEKTISFTENQLVSDHVFDLLEGELSSFPFPPHLFIKGNVGILLIEATDSWNEMHASVISFLEQFQKQVRTQFKRTVSFGISNICQKLIDVPDAFTEASDAISSGHLSRSAEFIQIYHAKDVPELLRLLPAEDVKKFYEATLQSLADRQKEDQSLLHTLSVYLETHCQISETAKRLYVHRNTVIYRLEKCEELLGKSLKDPETTMRLRLALRMQRLIG
ncbi:PucR family transcriptional regulator [Bacillus velezensis]|uniref:PucR family transcriptional regulator n=1 Tax=Bacillus TaxID=1386 RepID=UPI00073AD8A4|nr:MULTISPECIES: PucR family transcriptional regulator [Bacillus]ALV02601.1 PucR family transcriptional regulator [Bacillus amyloliquefaciens]UFH21933.1 PucR family transcriptional regulator [Bacillus velezensis]UUT16552.1 PucR family transcriptional regulator [Bacillus velezensis]BET18977.1 purine catabolism transcriptional regulator PucR [Bacillus velezensis]